MKRIGFLLGAGVSCASGYPGTMALTEAILSGAGYERHTSGTYVRAQSREIGPSVAHLVEYLNLLSGHARDFFAARRTDPSNYEEVLYLNKQVLDNESGDLDNPAVQFFIDHISKEVRPILDRSKSSYETIAEIAWEADRYARDVIRHQLSIKVQLDGVLEPILVGARDDALSRLDIFTLNHDLLLESVLRADDIEFEDGFSDPRRGVRYWNPRVFQRATARVRVMKLHGSIDWYVLRPDGPDFYRDRVGIPVEGDSWHTRNEGGELQLPVYGRPEFLAGTFNKPQEYTTGIYADLHCLFHRSLADLRVLVCSGYGFGDKVINTKLVEWLFSRRGNRLAVIHAEPERLWRKARPAVARHVRTWRVENQLIELPCWFEDVSWQDIRVELPRGKRI